MTNFKIELLVSDKENLQNEYGKRKKPYKTHQGELDPSKDFENKLWTTFFELENFDKLNYSTRNELGQITDQQCLVSYGQSSTQIDVCAENNEMIIFAEASTEEVNSSKIDSIIGHFAKFQKYAANEYQSKNIAYIFFTNSEHNLDLYSQNLRENAITLVSESYLDYLIELMTKYKNKNFAYHQFKNHLFYDKLDHSATSIKIPASKGRDNNGSYYLFNTTPEKLLKMTNVPHRRHELDKKNNSRGFQRLIKESKINKIVDYIKEREFAVFPTNLVLAINYPSSVKEDDKNAKDRYKRKFIKENQIEKVGLNEFVTLEISSKFGLFNVIDGQHRLFMYLDDALSDKSRNHDLLVLVYVDILLKNQIKVFMDINKEQTPVDPGLLWDLYPDIFDDENKDMGVNVKISKLAKKLNEDKTSALYRTMSYPSSESPINAASSNLALKLNTVCNSFLKPANGSGVFKVPAPKGNSEKLRTILNSDLNLDPSKLENIFGFYNIFFNSLKKAAGEKNWNTKKAGNFYKHNMSFQVFVSLCSRIMIYLIKKNENLDYKNLGTEFEKFLKPVSQFVDRLDTNEIKNEVIVRVKEDGKIEKELIHEIGKKYTDFEVKYRQDHEHIDFL